MKERTLFAYKNDMVINEKLPLYYNYLYKQFSSIITSILYLVKSKFWTKMKNRFQSAAVETLHGNVQFSNAQN